MKVIPFTFYYLKLQFSVAFGLHYTSHPLDLRWRWSYWQRRNEARRRNLAVGTGRWSLKAARSFWAL